MRGVTYIIQVCWGHARRYKLFGSAGCKHDDMTYLAARRPRDMGGYGGGDHVYLVSSNNLFSDIRQYSMSLYVYICHMYVSK